MLEGRGQGELKSVLPESRSRLLQICQSRQERSFKPLGLDIFFHLAGQVNSGSVRVSRQGFCVVEGLEGKSFLLTDFLEGKKRTKRTKRTRKQKDEGEEEDGEVEEEEEEEGKEEAVTWCSGGLLFAGCASGTGEHDEACGRGWQEETERVDKLRGWSALKISLSSAHERLPRRPDESDPDL